MFHVFYDTETTGADVRYDQILQFAAIFTDEAFNEIETFDIRCRRLPHIVPRPEALMVTGVDPYAMDREPLSHFDMACRIHEKLSNWSPAIYLGYNTLQFDEEILRQTFWQTLLPPYVTSSARSLRADVLTMARAAVAAHPGILEIPAHPETGNPIYKLEVIAPLNGFEGHDAHDALGDVRATIHIAKLIRDRAPEIWNLMLDNADPKRSTRLLDAGEVRLLTHYGAPEIHRVVKVAENPENAKKICAFDLSSDPTPYLDLDAEAMAKAMADDFRILREIKLNAQPVFFDPKDPRSPAPTEEIDEDLVIERRRMIAAHPDFAINVAEAMRIRQNSFPKGKYAEERIYEGFPSWDDKGHMENFHHARRWSSCLSVARNLADDRVSAIAKRLIYFHGPEAYPKETREAFEWNIIQNRILTEEEVPWTTLKEAQAALDGLPADPHAERIRAWFADFAASLENGILPLGHADETLFPSLKAA